MRRWLIAVGPSAVVALVVAFPAWAIGVTLRQSAVIFVCVLAVGVGCGVIEVHQLAIGGEQWRGRWSLARSGARRDVRQLGWRLRADDGRVHGAAVQRLQDVAAQRLRRHGIDLADPAQAAAAEALLGATAYRVVTGRGERAVRYAAFVRAIDALERLAAAAISPPASTSAPHPGSG